MIDRAVSEIEALVGTAPACRALGAFRASGSITVDRVTVTGWRERSDSSTLDASRSL